MQGDVAMKKTVLLSTLLLTTTYTFAGEEVDETLAASRDGFVSIEHLSGEITIKGWDKDEVKVVGELDERARDFIFERDGNEITIEVLVRKGSWKNFNSDQGDDLEVYLPRRSRVKYHSVNADVDASKIEGGISIEVVNGDIDAKELSRKVRLETVNGDIHSRNLEGQISLETVNGDIDDENSQGKAIRYGSVNGDIEVSNLSPRVSVDTVNGDIELSLDVISELEINTVNGDIETFLTLSDRGEFEANSVGGDMEFTFNKDLSASFDIEAHAGGRITNNITEQRAKKAKYGPSSWLNFKVDDGDARVRITTVSGRIELNKGN
jgi:DUF4097 and DUF4098 domain-containing protein YvlB